MGIFIGLIIVALWLWHLLFCLTYVSLNFTDPLIYLHILFQAYLFTGVFITSHDAIHGTVSSNKALNKAVGFITCFLYAGFLFNRVSKNHHKHHSDPAAEDDPDFSHSSQNFIIWWFKFVLEYAFSIQMILLLSIFGALSFFFRFEKVIALWGIPLLLSTLQLFYFGVYNPHKLPHLNGMNRHKARSQKKNHILAMLSCYFFGYHYEHHEYPNTPWWQLYKLR